MTEDNLSGLVLGLLMTIVFAIAIFHIPRLTRWSKALFTRTHGKFWAKRVNEGFVTIMIVLCLAVGILFTVVALVGGFDANHTAT